MGVYTWDVGAVRMVWFAEGFGVAGAEGRDDEFWEWWWEWCKRGAGEFAWVWRRDRGRGGEWKCGRWAWAADKRGWAVKEDDVGWECRV